MVLMQLIPDYFKAAVSFATASLMNPFSIVASIIPHLLILGAFGGFVYWNDGVVLGKFFFFFFFFFIFFLFTLVLHNPICNGANFVSGHKEFHTAGVHLAQMLYIWPYFAFFSWPLLVIPVINWVLPKSALPKYLDYGLPNKQKQFPKLLTALIVLPIMLAIVHFNTIVHPFTLADNRHYVFYVFRLLLGVHPAVKYAAVLVYFACGWAVIYAYGFTISLAPPRLIQVPRPGAAAAPAPAPATPEPNAEQKPAENRKTRRANEKAATKKGQQQAQTPKQKQKQQQPDPISAEAYAKVQESLIKRQKEQPGVPRASFILVWFAATTLSLVTAPLVEPRYFIIPWVMWRLHLPQAPGLAAFRKQKPQNEKERELVDLATNAPKFIETIWFVIINVVTGYLFLYKGFEWPQEPGKIQRFMW